VSSIVGVAWPETKCDGWWVPAVTITKEIVLVSVVDISKLWAPLVLPSIDFFTPFCLSLLFEVGLQI